MAEYFRDIGLSVSLLADSISHWEECLHEMSSFCHYPAYSDIKPILGNKLAHFYERAGRVQCLGSPEREGALTIVGAVSPYGRTFSGKTATASLSIVDVFWALDAGMAQRRHYPALHY